MVEHSGFHQEEVWVWTLEDFVKVLLVALWNKYLPIPLFTTEKTLVLSQLSVPTMALQGLPGKGCPLNMASLISTMNENVA